MASIATSALASLAPADSKLASRLQTMAVPQSVGLPSLPPTPHGASPSCPVGARSWKAPSYCRRVARDIVARAAGEAPAELAFDLPEVVKSIQDAWDRMEDKYAMTSLAAAGFIGLWVTSGVISAVDRLPLAPSVFELVGIGYTGVSVPPTTTPPHPTTPRAPPQRLLRRTPPPLQELDSFTLTHKSPPPRALLFASIATQSPDSSRPPPPSPAFHRLQSTSELPVVARPQRPLRHRRAACFLLSTSKKSHHLRPHLICYRAPSSRATIVQSPITSIHPGAYINPNEEEQDVLSPAGLQVRSNLRSRSWHQWPRRSYSSQKFQQAFTSELSGQGKSLKPSRLKLRSLQSRCRSLSKRWSFVIPVMMESYFRTCTVLVLGT